MVVDEMGSVGPSTTMTTTTFEPQPHAHRPLQLGDALAPGEIMQTPSTQVCPFRHMAPKHSAVKGKSSVSPPAVLSILRSNCTRGALPRRPVARAHAPSVPILSSAVI